MYRRLFFLSMLIISISVTVKADFEGSYVEINYIETDENGEEQVIGTSEWDCGSGSSMYNIYYKTSNNGIGISGGNYVDHDDVTFEMPYYLRLTQLSDRILLRGVLRAYNLDGFKILSGSRYVIYQDIEYNKEIKFRVKPSENIQEVGINITLVNENPVEVIYDGPISLRTNFVNVKDVFGLFTSTQGLITEKVEFRTGTGKKRDDGYFEQAKLLTEVLLPNYPEELTKPFQTELTFRRIYKIDTLYVSEREFTTDITYTSEYKRNIEIVPGKTLLLVFPADTPSVRGFDREDTLVIKP